MDEDYQTFGEEQTKQMDKLGINYVWRDSCVHILIQMKICMKNDYLSYFTFFENFSECKGIQKLWKDCEFNRESMLLDKYFNKYSEMEKKVLKKNI